MFELPEMEVLSRQINESLAGKVIQRGELSNSPHKFVWHNLSHAEFSQRVTGKRVGQAWVQGRWLFIPLEPEDVLLIGECGGKFIYHPAGAKTPKKYHLHLEFDDGSFLSATTQMWGAYELYQAGEEQNREYVKDMAPTPLDPAFTVDYFRALIARLAAEKKTSVKALLTQEQSIPGLGNAVAQDIMFQARLLPRHSIAELDDEQQGALYAAIGEVVKAVIEQGGRYDEYDLHGQRGGYVRLMDKNAVGKPCPRCGGTVEKSQYLGGACYSCTQCQT